jgi:hypothetical protein
VKDDRFHTNLIINRLCQAIVWFVLLFLLHRIFRFNGAIVLCVALIRSRVQYLVSVIPRLNGNITDNGTFFNQRCDNLKYVVCVADEE